MSPLDRASAIADTYAGLVRCEPEIVAERDRVNAEMEIVRGGWHILIDGVLVHHVDADGKATVYTDLEELREIVARRAA